MTRDYLLFLSCILWFCGLSFSLDNGLGLTPQMAWNSWNTYECKINETIVKATALALIKNGLKDVGYDYINVDDCWAYSRNASGYIQADPTTFPSGMKALADFVHSLGLKFGLYSDSGNKTCAGRPGSLGYETQDAEIYAEWGVDYLKYDNCNNGGLPDLERYTTMSKALNATGRPIFFSLCDWTVTTAFWGPYTGNSWRTTADILPWWDSWTNNLDQNNLAQPYAGPGGWNDPDMLEVGDGLSPVENVAHFSLWALVKGPLVLGNDLTNLTSDVLQILSNTEVIAVNQDTLGIQGQVVKRYPATSDNSSVFGNVLYADTCDGSPAQKFFYNTTSGNIMSELTGQCMGQFIPPWACDYDPYMGAALYLQPCNGPCNGQMQNWTINGNTIKTNFNSDAPFCLQSISNNIFLWNCNGTSNQTWTYTNGAFVGGNGNCLTVSGGQEVWAVPLSDGSVSVVLFNRAPIAQNVTLNFSDIAVTYPAQIRDLWAAKDLGIFENEFTAPVESHGVVMLRISKQS